jgi:dynactin complex subunit
LIIFGHNLKVVGHDGQWIGVEWDDSTRGRHNGTVNGQYYFETK